jgi:hypothetical protein
LIGIFQGKEAENHRLILKGLVFGPKTTKQIAEYIYLNRRAAVKPQKLNFNKVKTIVSIISRKGSRLEELEIKEYISRKENLWQLTPKGMGVALTSYDSIVEIYPYVKPFLHSIVEDFRKTVNENPMFQFMKKIEKNAFKISFNFFESQDFLQFLKDLTNELIRQGVDLDKTSLKDFLSMLIGKFFVVSLPKYIMEA